MQLFSQYLFQVVPYYCTEIQLFYSTLLIFINPNFFFMNSLGVHKIMSSANTVLLLPFQSGCLLFHSLSKSPWQEIPSTLNQSAESQHPCLVSYLQGKLSAFRH